MATSSSKFIPELWSQKLIETMKENMIFGKRPKRSYGEKLLRAAAKGEDWADIKRVEDPHETYTSHAADALAYAIDRDILNSNSKRGKSK